jgi:perosamine synthetase
MSLGPPGRGPLEVALAAARGGAVPDWPQLPAGRTILTHQGRGAIGLACRMFGLRTGDEVLTPSWNCGTEVDAVLATGASVVLYRVDEDARIDVDDLRRRVTSRTRAVHAIHYFGRPQPLDDVRALCRERGLRLVEDCALALFSSDGDAPLGRDADAAVFSFPKTLPVPDGGALTLLEPPPAPPMLTRPAPARILRRTLGLVKHGLGLRPRARAVEHVRARPDMPADYYWNERTALWSMSRTTRGLLARTDPSQVVARRRANWLRLRDRLREVAGAAPLFGELATGECPLHMAVLVEDRAAWLAALQARGVAAIGWWAGYHRALPWDQFPEACALKDRVLALPVHQALGAAAIDRLAEIVTETARSIAPAPPPMRRATR